jgi:hypothetical protein
LLQGETDRVFVAVGDSVSTGGLTMYRAPAIGLIGRFLGALSILAALQTTLAAESRPSVPDEIRIEALRPNDDPIGRLLPLACSWTCGHYPSDRSAGWRPQNQMRLVEEGHYLLPWFSHPGGEVPPDPEAFLRRYYQGPIEQARQMNLPLTSRHSRGISGDWGLLSSLRDDRNRESPCRWQRRAVSGRRKPAGFLHTGRLARGVGQLTFDENS